MHREWDLMTLPALRHLNGLAMRAEHNVVGQSLCKGHGTEENPAGLDDAPDFADRRQQVRSWHMFEDFRCNQTRNRCIRQWQIVQKSGFGCNTTVTHQHHCGFVRVNRQHVDAGFDTTRFQVSVAGTDIHDQGTGLFRDLLPNAPKQGVQSWPVAIEYCGIARLEVVPDGSLVRGHDQSICEMHPDASLRMLSCQRCHAFVRRGHHKSASLN